MPSVIARTITTRENPSSSAGFVLTSSAGRRDTNKALHLASLTRTSYLRLVLLKHLGLRGPQKPIHDAFGDRADHGRLRVEQNGILEPRKNLA